MNHFVIMVEFKNELIVDTIFSEHLDTESSRDHYKHDHSCQNKCFNIWEYFTPMIFTIYRINNTKEYHNDNQYKIHATETCNQGHIFSTNSIVKLI